MQEYNIAMFLVENRQIEFKPPHFYWDQYCTLKLFGYCDYNIFINAINERLPLEMVDDF